LNKPKLTLTHPPPQKWRFLQKKTSKIALLVSCQRSDLLENIEIQPQPRFRILGMPVPVYTDAAPVLLVKRAVPDPEKR